MAQIDGKVIATCLPRHRHQGFLRFLRQIDTETPAGLDLHLIVDHYATYKHPKVKAWPRAYPDIARLVPGGPVTLGALRGTIRACKHAAHAR